MMKRILPLLLALLLLTGCAPKTPAEEQTSPEERPVQVLPEEPEPEPLDYSSIALADAPGFYDLTALPQLEECGVADAALLDETHAVLLTGEERESVQILDLETGGLEELCRLEWEAPADGDGREEWYSRQILSADPLIVSELSWEDTYYRIGLDGTVTELPDREDCDWLFYDRSAFLEERFYSYQSSSGILYRMDYARTEPVQVGHIPADYLYIEEKGLSQTGEQMVFLAETMGERDRVTLTMELETGAVTAYAGWDCAKALLPGTRLSLTYPEDGGGSCAITAWKEEEQVSVEFDFRWLVGDQESFDPDSCWLENPQSGTSWGTSLVMAWDGQKNRLLLWDYSGAETEPAPVERSEYVWPVYDLGELSQRAEELEAAYGVRVYLGQEAASLPFPDYTLESSEDLRAMSDGLDVLEQALAYYPEGYLSQLGGDTVRDLCFCLSGRMTPVDPSASIDDPGGLACQVDGLELMAFNVEYIQVRDVIHELTHVLDHWLWTEETLDEGSWSALNPEGFDYYYAYIDENGQSYETTGSTQYTTWDEAWYSGDVDSVYFIDPYSTTYPTEDRARLMEYVLAGSWNGPDSSFASVHLQAKLSYYFECIRNTFDTIGWPEQTSWEQALASMAPEPAE